MSQSSDPSRRTASWKSGKAVPARSGLAAPRWKKSERQSSLPAPTTRWPRSVRFISTLTIGTVAATLFLWLFSWLQPLPQAEIALFGAGYQETLALPHNAYGVNGLNGLRNLFDTARKSALPGLRSLQTAPVMLTSDTQIADELGRSSARLTILVLSMHGASDGDGPFLYLDRESTSTTTPAKLYLKDLFRQLKALSPRRFLLVLDATQSPAFPQFGVLHNDFAEKLLTLRPEIEATPNLLVINASGLNQRSWVSERWRTTAFAHYLAEGLSGGKNTLEGKRIDAEGLFQYVKANVQRWAFLNRKAAQTPVLIPENGRRARSFVLSSTPRVVLAKSNVEHPIEAIPTALRSAWESAWDDYQGVVNGRSASVDTPLLWRRYRDRLIRFDQLVRANDSKAIAAKRLVDTLRDRLRTGPRIAMVSSLNSLAMPAAEGPAPADPTPAQADFNVLWSDPNAVKDGVSATDPARRWAFTRMLYNRVQDDPSAENLATAARLLPEISAAGRPRPAEIHFLTMLAANAPADPVNRSTYQMLTAQALKLRAHAERAALGINESETSYPERVSPWITSLVVEADRSRRRGEDLIFANDLNSWEKAGVLLESAERLYRRADADAARARQAIIACERAQADLPVYAEWAAALPPEANPADEPAARVKTLLALSQALAARLKPLDPKAPTAAELGSLEKDAQELSSGMTALDQAFQDAAKDTEYPAVAAALLTPFLASSTDREASAKRLVELSPEAATAAQPSASGLAAAQHEADDSTEFAERRLELLSLALIGDDWSEADATPADSSHVAPENGDTERAETPPPVHVGDRIGSRWRAMPLAVGRWIETAALARADRVSRRLPGSVDLKLPEPATVYRTKLLRDLLVNQAQRTLTDHWYGTDDGPEAEPYFRTAGLAYLKDVRDLDPNNSSPNETITALRTALERRDRLELEGPAPLVVTSESRAEIEFRLRLPKDSLVPEGFPVVWISREPEGLMTTEPGRGVRVSREVRAVAAASGSANVASPTARFRVGLDVDLTRKVEANPGQFRRPELRKSSVVLSGFYRGQSLHIETPVTFHPVPEAVSLRYPLPTRGKVAVSADPGLVARFGEGGGAVAVVLDCSGSMAGVTERTPEGATASTKYQEATAALRQLLSRISRGTVVSLWVFGEAIAAGNSSENAEATILRVLKPTAWDPNDPSQLDAVMGQVESPKLQPWNESPIVRTMILARDDLRDAEGFKTLLVLTDGKDNRFDKDFDMNRAKKDIPSALRDAFAGSDVEINVVGYKLPDAEEVEARSQFKVIEELPRPGRFFSVKDARLLASTLGQALRPSLRCSVETVGNEPRALLTVSRTGENDRWSEPGLTAGSYKMVARAGGRQERDLILNRGDLLLVRMTEQRGGLAIDRGLFNTEKTLEERANGWRFSLVRNGQPGPSRDGLAVWAALEKVPTASETALEVVKPREVWMEVNAAATAGEAYTQRWSPQIGLPAPCWSVVVPSWPKTASTDRPARPTLRAWWDPDQEVSLTTEVVRLADFASTDEIPAREVRVRNRSVFIESVTVEPRKVELSPGRFRQESCLVVRLRHEEGDPFFVRPQGLRPEGAEHRFYARANRYTGIYWPVTRDQADVALTGLGLVSVAEFKARAERRGYYVERQAPGSPDVRDTGPSLITFDGPDSEPAPPPEPLGNSPPFRR